MSRRSACGSDPTGESQPRYNSCSCARAVARWIAFRCCHAICCGTCPKRWRIAPPLTVSHAEIDRAIAILDRALRESLDEIASPAPVALAA